MSVRRTEARLYSREGRPQRRRRFRVLWPVLALVSLGLLALSRLDHAVVKEVRWHIAELMTPVLGAALVPLEPVRWAGGHVSELFDLAKRLDEVRDENQRLRSWEWRAQELERKLKDMSELLRTVRDTALPFVTVRVVANSSGAFVRSAMINGGREQNIRPGYPVMGGDGLVGRVVDAGETAARVLLLTDLNSRIPVHIGKTGARAVLTGDNGPLPRLAYLPADAGVVAGDEVSTSGIGGLFPRGLRIGVVVDGQRGPRVRPHANLDSLEYLSVLFYESPALEITDGNRTGPGASLAPNATPTDRQARAGKK